MINLQEHGEIFYYKNVIDNPDFLVTLIESTDEYLDENTSITKWKDWNSSDKSYEFGKQKFITNKIKDETNSDLVLINKKISDAIHIASKDYADKKGINIGSLTQISISKYYKDKEMGNHIDSYGDDRDPVLSVVLYLNDDYVGGELYFKNQNLTIKPLAGSIVVFPSVAPYYHESRRIIVGTKYMSPGFWYKD